MEAASRSATGTSGGPQPAGLDPNGRLVRHIARMDFDFTERPSPNFDERALPVSMIVLHYTGMPDCEGALCRLTSPDAQVSAHYCIDEDGTIYRLVDESNRAWHAGKSRWRGVADVNSASVGIEIVNPG